MPADLSPRLLGDVLGRVLEEAAFVFVEPAEEAPPEGPLLRAQLRYVGRHAGELSLVMSERFAATVAASILGEEEGGEELTGDDRDALGEVLNMVAGVLAVELFGEDSRCALGLPVVARLAAEEHRRELAAADAVALLMDEGGQRVALSARRLAGAGR